MPAAAQVIPILARHPCGKGPNRPHGPPPEPAPAQVLLASDEANCIASARVAVTGVRSFEDGSRDRHPLRLTTRRPRRLRPRTDCRYGLALMVLLATHPWR